MAPDQIETISDATDLLVDQQDVTPLGPRLPGDRAPDDRGPARRRPPPRAPRDEGLSDGRGSGIVYLDVDDEITSAAARIRGVRGDARSRSSSRTAPGSATSRMNFRLLSREAIVNNRRLSIVRGRPGDAGPRGVGRAAGVRVGGRVRRGVRRAERRRRRARTRRPGAGGRAPRRSPATGSSPRPSPAEEPATGAIDERPALAARLRRDPEGRACRHRRVRRDARPPASRRRGHSAAPRQSAASRRTARRRVPRAAPVPPAVASDAASAPTGFTPRPPTAAPTVVPAPTVRVPVIRSRRMPRIGTTAARHRSVSRSSRSSSSRSRATSYLPSASISVTPKAEPIPPISSRSAPTRTPRPPTRERASSRPAGSTCRSRCRTRSRRRASAVEEAQAKGTVTFRNVDFTASNTIAGGSVVSTQSGVRFRTDRTITVGKARLVGLQVFPTEADVGVTAVKAGEAGNVEPNTITRDPRGRGSAHAVGPEQGRDERRHPRGVPAGLAGRRRRRARQARHGARRRVPRGRRRRQRRAPERDRSTPTRRSSASRRRASTRPRSSARRSLTFDLGLNATGSVIAVDASPVEGVARSRLMANVGSDYRLVDGSVDIEQGPATVTNGQVSFPVTARRRASASSTLRSSSRSSRASRSRSPDGRLAPFGQVRITPWPDWVLDRPEHRSAGQPRDRRPGRVVGRRSRRVIARRIAARRQREPVTRLLGVDLGERRIGLAIADRDGGSAFALTTLNRARDDGGGRRGAARAWPRTRPSTSSVVGLPLHANGDEGSQAAVTPRVGRRGRPDPGFAGNLPRRASDEPPRRIAGGSHETGPFRRAADASAARRLSRQDRSRGCRDHPPGRAGRTSSGCRRDRRHDRPRDEHDQAAPGPTRTDNDTETPR